MRILKKMIYFGLYWNLRLISYYRVLITSWRILVSFRGFSVQITFFGWPVQHLSFHNSSFAFKILFNVNGKVTQSVTHPLFSFLINFILLGFGETNLYSHGCWCCSNNYDYNLDPIAGAAADRLLTVHWLTGQC
jgi:hypothetical protein